MPVTWPISWGRLVVVKKNTCLAGEETQHSERLAIPRSWQRPWFEASLINFRTMIRFGYKDYRGRYIEELCRKGWRRKVP